MNWIWNVAKNQNSESEKLLENVNSEYENLWKSEL